MSTIQASEVSYLPAPKGTDQAHTRRLHVLRLSANYVVSGSADGSVRVWDKHRRSLALQPLRGSSSAAFTAVAISEERGIVIGGNTGGEIAVWRLTDGESLLIRTAHSDVILGLVLDTNVLVSASRDGYAKTWNLDQSGILHLRHILRDHDKPMLAVSTLNDRIVTSSGGSRLCVWDKSTGACTKTMDIVASIKQLEVQATDQGTWVVGACLDGRIRVYNIDEGTEVACLDGHEGVVCAVRIGMAEPLETKDGAAIKIVSAGNDGWVRVWSLKLQLPFAWRCVARVSFSDSAVYTFPSSRKVRNPPADVLATEYITLPFDVEMDGPHIYCCGESAYIMVASIGQDV